MGISPSIPIKNQQQLGEELEQRLRGSTSSSCALLYSDINHLSAWFDVYGVLDREAAIYQHFRTIAKVENRVQLEKGKSHLHYIGRHKFDKFLLGYTGSSNQEEIHLVAESIRDALNETEIPGWKERRPCTREFRGKQITLDPNHLTVRIGAVYQRQGPFDWKVLLEKTIEASRQAKHTEGQVLVVEYTP